MKAALVTLREGGVELWENTSSSADRRECFSGDTEWERKKPQMNLIWNYVLCSIWKDTEATTELLLLHFFVPLCSSLQVKLRVEPCDLLRPFNNLATTLLNAHWVHRGGALQEVTVTILSRYLVPPNHRFIFYFLTHLWLQSQSCVLTLYRNCKKWAGLVIIFLKSFVALKRNVSHLQLPHTLQDEKTHVKIVRHRAMDSIIAFTLDTFTDCPKEQESQNGRESFT